MAEILEGAMNELPVSESITIQAVLQFEIKKRWEDRADSYWRRTIKSYVKALRVFRNNHIYLKEK
jgi:hypothetical protein